MLPVEKHGAGDGRGHDVELEVGLIEHIFRGVVVALDIELSLAPHVALEVVVISHDVGGNTGSDIGSEGEGAGEIGERTETNDVEFLAFGHGAGADNDVLRGGRIDGFLAAPPMAEYVIRAKVSRHVLPVGAAQNIQIKVLTEVDGLVAGSTMKPLGRIESDDLEFILP